MPVRERARRRIDQPARRALRTSLTTFGLPLPPIAFITCADEKAEELVASGAILGDLVRFRGEHLVDRGRDRAFVGDLHEPSSLTVAAAPLPDLHIAANAVFAALRLSVASSISLSSAPDSAAAGAASARGGRFR
jgi:hypothetical protein